MRNLKTIAALAAITLVVLGGILGYSFLRTPAAPSSAIEAIPLEANNGGSPSASASASAAGVATTEMTAAASAQATTAAPAATAVAAAPSASASASDTATASTAAASDTSVVPVGAFVAQIVQEESEARFLIDEVLNNEPVTVVGATNQVAGELAVDPQDPTKTRVGIIQINARTLTTDNDFRNRAIKNRILFTDQYEFITFEPTEIMGLPQDGTVGQTYTFQMVGNLTIRDVTQPLTFEVTATPTTDTRLEGTAKATIRYADFNITIPQVQQVASVSDDVRLESTLR